MRKSCWLLMLTLVAALAWIPVAQADGGTQLQRAADTIPDVALDAPSPSQPDGSQLRRVRALPNLENLPDLRTDQGKEELIRRSFAAVRLYSLASGLHPSFELSEFQTIQHIDFGRFRWFDLVTAPGGQVIQVTGHTSRGVDGRALSRQYKPQWTEAPQDYLQSPEGKRLADARIDQILAAAAADQPDLLGVTAVTAYRVQVTLDDETRTYGAAFLWKETGTGLTYQAYDQITGRVDQALTETIPAGRRKLDRKPGLDGLRNTSGATHGAAFCDFSENFNNYSLGAGDSQGHTSGAHQVDGTLTAICRCNADCSQDCTTTVVGTCQEFGTTGTCHRISNASEASGDGNAFDATSAGSTASCGGGLACSWQECFGCFCSPSISVSWGGVGIRIGSFSGTATIQKDRVHTCAPCSVIPEEEPTDPPPSGGGGGGGGGPEPCSCDCDGDGWVTVEECIFDCGGIADTEAGVCWV